MFGPSMKLPILKLTAVVVLAGIPVVAAYAADCPTRAPLLNLCNTVSGMIKDDDPKSDYVYAYQRKIYEAACVQNHVGATNAEISLKVRALFAKFPEEFLCTSTDFKVSRGSILKYAVGKRFDSLVQDATLVWRLDLNNVDESDGRTLLDYIEYEVINNQGTANESILKRYYALARRAGALHRRELPASK